MHAAACSRRLPEQVEVLQVQVLHGDVGDQGKQVVKEAEQLNQTTIITTIMGQARKLIAYIIAFA